MQGTPNLDPLPRMDRDIIARALSKNPTDRWPTSMALVEALHNARDEDDESPTTVALQRDSETQVPFSLVPANPPATVPVKPEGKPGESYQPNQPTDHLSKMKSAHLQEFHLQSGTASTGVLRPTIFLGLGKMGRAMLQHLKSQFQEVWGTADVPLFSMLAVDTDETRPDAPLLDRPFPEELVHMPLSRPARYVRSRDHLPPVEDWLDTNLLYRMPRTLTTNGIRALGRLALIEHNESLMHTLENTVREVISTQAEAETRELTGLDLRTKEPLIYVISHLGGGTGSGMFVDCAYLARSLLRKKGMGGEVAAILLSPEFTEGMSPDLPEANAVAAIKELDHFQRGTTSFQGRFSMKGEPLTDAAAPFHHCLLAEVPPRPAKLAAQQFDPACPVLSRLARSLIHITAHPLGQTGEPGWLRKSSNSVYQLVSTQVVTTAREAVLQQASQVICNQVIDHWLKETPSERTGRIHEHMNQFLQQQKLNSNQLVEFLNQAVTNVLGRPGPDYCKQMLANIDKPLKEYLPIAKEIDKALQNILDLLGS
ncbi:MAG TPA: tubulin-like doman-containing protein, partial [Gemmatales bacterium]|nr:tubulin-like doman-containing protein [Gemmatales bacterium]